MDIYFERLSPAHRVAVMDIFNYYIEKDTSAFANNPLKDDFFNLLLERGLPSFAVMFDNRTIGFCMLNPFNAFSTFENTASTSIFLNSSYTKMGIGSKCLNLLEEEARNLNIKSLVAEISSLNQASIKFHLEHGYKIAGNLKNIGFKKGETFSLIYMQKFL